MRKPKFTPGPWKYIETQSGDYLIEGESASDFHATAHFFDAGGPCNESPRANAALIAAAPELYEAAIAFIVYLRDFFPDEPLFFEEDEAESNEADTLRDLRAALAKAEAH